MPELKKWDAEPLIQPRELPVREAASA
jgi:hypothetical protein